VNEEALAHWGGLLRQIRREIFGPKREEVTEEWRRLFNEELRILYSSADNVLFSTNKMSWACGTYGGQKRFAVTCESWVFRLGYLKRLSVAKII